MDERQLKEFRNEPQSVTNILGTDFDYKWDGLDYTIKKGEQKTHPRYLAENCAKHMARAYCTQEGLKYEKVVGEVMDKIMNKETIEYNKLTKTQAIELATERGIPTEEEGKERKKVDIINDLKASH